MADNDTLPATGDVIRSIDRAGVKTQVTQLDVGGAGGEVLVSAANPLPSRTIPPATGTASRVSASATSVSILAANTARKGASVLNDSTSLLYLLLGAGNASSTNFTKKLNPGESLDIANGEYGGVISGIWVAAAGAAQVTEYT